MKLVAEGRNDDGHRSPKWSMRLDYGKRQPPPGDQRGLRISSLVGVVALLPVGGDSIHETSFARYRGRRLEKAGVSAKLPWLVIFLAVAAACGVLGADQDAEPLHGITQAGLKRR